MRNILICIFLLIGLCLVSCYHTQNVVKDVNKPEWYYRPNIAGKIGGVGISGPHVSGLNAQRDLAVTRAIDDISRQMGVAVQNITKIETIGDKNSTQTQMESYSIQTVKGETVRAKIKEFWEDPETKQLYVWMVVE